MLGGGDTGGEDYNENEEERRLPSDEARERVSFVFSFCFSAAARG